MRAFFSTALLVTIAVVVATSTRKESSELKFGASSVLSGDFDLRTEEDPTFHFQGGGKTIMSIEPNGDFTYRGEKIKGAREVYEKVAAFMNEAEFGCFKFEKGKKR